MRIETRRRRALAGGLAALALVATACGGDGDETRTVTAEDYRFEDLPATVDAGTTFKLTNASDVELHEMVMFRIPDNERRSVEELIRLPEEELGAIFQGEPAMVLLAPPNGGDQITAVGDGKLTQPGRYAVVCFIPTGADPGAYLSAAQAGGEGPPQVAGGPPHAFNGMFAQVTVR
ncbi:MAG: hypothetical protein ACLGI2_10185 [Acidimicrobiia bacterium]